jgi:IS30 family transposase
MKKNYSHLSAEERAVIMIEREKDASVRAIARLLGRSASTVSHELARNRDGSKPSYDATRAGAAYRTRREFCRSACTLATRQQREHQRPAA